MRVLVVSKSFPPLGSARALQIEKVVRAISHAGCRSYVIAGVERSKRGNVGNGNQGDPYSVRYVPFDPPKVGRTAFAKIWHRLLSELRSSNLRCAWVRGALRETLCALETFRPHIVLTSSSPFESHLVGLQVKKRERLPWIASFSDPWPDDLNPPPYNLYNAPILRTWQMHLLRNLLRWSDGLHMPNRHALELVASGTRLPILSKSYSIPHIGCESRHPSTGPGNGWLAHIGFLHRERVSKSLLQAVQTFARRRPHVFKGLLLVGKVCPEFLGLARKMGVHRCLKLMGHMPAQEAMQLAAEAQALLVVEADMPYSPYLPSKFADYACMGRPIIAITPPISPIRDYLGKYGGGYAVRHSTEEILRAIQSVFDRDSHTPEIRGPDTLEVLGTEFRPQVVASKYMDMFSTVLTSIANRTI